MARTVASNWRVAIIDTLNYCKTVAHAIKIRHANLMNKVEGVHSIPTEEAAPRQVKRKIKSKTKGVSINRQHACHKASMVTALQLKYPTIVHSPNANESVLPVQHVDELAKQHEYSRDELFDE